MTTYNTGNPIGSTDPRDLSDNSENFDNAVNNTASVNWTDRFGVSRVSLAGQVGYVGTGAGGAIESYAAGLVMGTYNTIILYSGEFYRPSASATLPYTTTATLPDVDSNLVSVGDAVLRQDLAASGGALLVTGVVQRVSSRTEMKTYDVPANYQFSLEEGGRSGLFVVKAGAPPSDPQEGIFVVLANGNYAERNTKDPVTVKQYGAKGDGVTLDDAAFLASGPASVPEGDYVLSDNVPTTGYYGNGVVLKSGNRIFLESNQTQISAIDSPSDFPLTAINPMGFRIKGNYAFVTSQGSYNGSQAGSIDCFDISDVKNIKRASSLTTPIGSLPRATAIRGDYLYVRDFNGALVRIINISDPYNISVAATTAIDNVSNNAEHWDFFGDVLVNPTFSGTVDFFTIDDPLKPKLLTSITVPGVLHSPIFVEGGFWVATHNDGSSNNLHYISMKGELPELISSTVIPSLKFCRYAEVQNGYLYATGFDSTSAFNVIDVSDINDPTVVFVAPFTEAGGVVSVSGNIAITSTGRLYDISNPESPVESTETVPDLIKALFMGDKYLGFTVGTGPQGPASNDSNEGSELASVAIKGVNVSTGAIGGLKSKRIDTDNFRANVQGHIENFSAETSYVKGASSIGSLSLRSGNIQRGSQVASADFVGNGLLNTSTLAYKVYGERSLLFRLKYDIVRNQSAASSSIMAIGEKVFAVHLSGTSLSSIIAVTDLTGPIANVSTALNVTLTAPSIAGNPIEIYVDAPDLSTGSPFYSFNLQVSSFSPVRIESQS
jgi:hypothetical protein